MNAILVWVLLIHTNMQHSTDVISYSPPFATLEECDRVKTIIKGSSDAKSRCIQMRIVK